MIFRFLCKPYMIASLTVWLLIFGSSVEPEASSRAATPQPSPITLVQPDYQLWQRIPENLNYSAENLKFAGQSIAQTQARLSKVVSSWRSRGVVRIKKSFANSVTDKRLAFYPQYSKFAKSYTLIGIDAKGKQVTSTIWPDRGQYSESRYRLIALKNDNCQIINSKKSDYCVFNTPATRDWLRVAIIERVNFVEANSGTYWFTRDLLNVFNSQEPYTIRDGKVFSESISNENLVTGGLPLAAKVDIFNYKIEIGPDNWHATYTMSYMKPQQIADGLIKTIDSFGEITLTPSFKW